MRFGFRKSFKAGPFRTTVTKRGLTHSVGAGGLRVSTGRRRKKKAKSEGSGLLGFLILAALAAFLLF
jgi:hypothetical protein